MGHSLIVRLGCSSCGEWIKWLLSGHRIKGLRVVLSILVTHRCLMMVALRRNKILMGMLVVVMRLPSLWISLSGLLIVLSIL